MNSLKLDLDVNELYYLNEFVKSLIGRVDFQVELILEEIFVNIVNYSKGDYIHINATFENQELTIEFVDNGIPFNLLVKEDPKLPDNIEEAEIGGRGIFLTKQMADNIEYEYDGNENHLKIVKKVK